MYRCPNDLFNYCSSEPKWGDPPKPLGPGLYPGSGNCQLDPETCGKHQSLREQVGDRLTQAQIKTGDISPPSERGTPKPKKTTRRQKS